MSPTREVYWNISHIWVMYLLLIPALSAFVWGCYQRLRAWRLGQPADRFNRWPERIRHLIKFGVLQERIVRNPLVGVMHSSLSWAMLLLFIGTTVVAIDTDLRIHIMHGQFYLYFQSLILDVAGALATIALGIAVLHRYVLKPARLRENRPGTAPPGDGLMLGWLFLIFVQGFIVEGIRITMTNDPWGAWSPVGKWVGQLLAAVLPPAGMLALHKGMWWFHLVTVFTWIAAIPYTKMFHVFTSPLAILFADLTPKGEVIGTMDFATAERFGVSALTDFTWKDLLDLDACTACGRCQDVCPAYAAGQPLSPKNLILDLRDHMTAEMERLHRDPLRALFRGSAYAEASETPRQMVGDVIKPETLWACTTCRACMEACPVEIEHVPKIIGMRRHLTMEQAEIPNTVAVALQSLEDRQHPYKGAAASRTDWTEGLDVPVMADVQQVDVLYWVGCTAAFDPRNQKVARAFAQVMQHAGVSFAILGKEESCCGDPARRTGQEFLYDMVAKQNVDTLKGYQFKRIVTACPHCLNALLNEYKPYGADFEVVHHTQLLKELADEGKLSLRGEHAETVTFHDPCYLGRYNDVFDAPRELLEELPMVTTLEMGRNRSNSMCCGAGGGHAWMEEQGTRVNHLRAQEAVETGAGTVGTGCPFCLQMMEDGVKTVTGGDGGVKVRDLAELVLQALEETGPDQV
ncbi:MAG: putative iron-sulfur cluster-binding protein, partial [Firmicutes bacterium]|nr:putative iron-sulfur cluster-binding protein [Bacillota bacterium]